jgi:hypothetical protein
MNKEEFKKFVLEEAKKYLKKDTKIAPGQTTLKNEAIEEKLNKDKSLDPVGDEDTDINNDGKVDSKDSYLKNRRKAINKAIDKDCVEENVSPTQIAELAEELKKINKTFDFRNTVVVSMEENTADTVIKENAEVAATEEDKSIFREHKGKWKNLLDYNIPSDENRI